MPRINNLYRRGAIYYFRKIVTYDLNENIDLRISLKTSSQFLSKKLSYFLNIFIQDYSVLNFKNRGNYLTSDQQREILTKVTSEERDRLLAQFQSDKRLTGDNDATLAQTLEINDEWKSIHGALPNLFHLKGLEDAKLDKAAITLQNKMIAAQLKNTGVSARYRNQIIEHFDLLENAAVSDDVWKLVCEGIQKAVDESNTIISSQAEFKPAEVELKSQNLEPVIVNSPVKKQKMSEEKLLDRFFIFQEQQLSLAAWGNSAGKDVKTAARRYSEIYPNDRVIDVNYDKLKNLLGCMERKEPQKGFKKGQEAKSLKGKGVSVDKINGTINAIKQIIDFDRKEGLEVQSIEWDLLKTSKRERKIKKERREYVLLEDAKKIFSTSIYTGAAGAAVSARNKPIPRFQQGDEIYQDACYWVPLILYYTGMRPAEACSLMVDDFIIVEDRPCIVIRANLMACIKAVASYRIIPAHLELIRLGLADYVKACKKAGHEALFPELVPIRLQTNAGDICNRLVWSKIKEHLLTDTKNKNITMGCFRHGVQTYGSRSPEVRQRFLNEYLGRECEDGDVGESIYNAGGFMPVLDIINDQIPIATDHLEPQPINLIPTAILVGRQKKELQGRDFHQLPARNFWTRAHLELLDNQAEAFEKYLVKHDVKKLIDEDV